ncbi:MAG: hypothetical protein DMG10_27650 [Acidobacteria bacterium]|nr:MAG: hypothetical protein DMG10_27650 [Acidobacteriota bacterium]
MTTEIAEPQPNYLLSVLCVLRVLAVKALSGINREDAKGAKNARRRILSKQLRICAVVVQMNTDPCSFLHLWFHFFWLRLCRTGEMTVA